jgi:hypothetical protein
MEARMKYDILYGLTRLFTVTIIVGKMSNDLAIDIVNAERKKRRLAPLKMWDYITFVPVIEEEFNA